MTQAIRTSPLRNFHLPLPDALYRQLREAAESEKQPATFLARQAIQSWLGDRRRAAVHEAIASYAAQHAGTEVDLDPELEAASLEQWRPRRSRPRERRKR